MKDESVNPEIAAVALLVFNRPQHTARVFEAIRAARPRHLLVVADGPRPGREEDVELCRETRKIVSSPDWPCELLTNFSEENMGCGRRVASGLDWVFEQFPEAIILEDDCLPVSSFFRFCTTLLERYRDDTRVMSVSGSNFQLGNVRGSASYYFSNYTQSWGWATWKRAWSQMDFSLSAWPAARQEGWLSSVLDDPLEIAYWSNIFEKQYRGKIDTWDYQWLFRCWSQNGLTAISNQNLVTNVGVGADATHTKRDSKMLGIPGQELGDLIHPTTMVRDKAADRFLWEEHILHLAQQRPKRVRLVTRARNALRIKARAQHLLQWAGVTE